MKNLADRGGGSRWITPSKICLILHILRKPNSLIALLVIQKNNSYFKNKLNHAYLRRCQVHLYNGCLEDKGLFSSANILQKADFVHRAVFLLCF